MSLVRRHEQTRQNHGKRLSLLLSISDKKVTHSWAAPSTGKMCSRWAETITPPVIYALKEETERCSLLSWLGRQHEPVSGWRWFPCWGLTEGLSQAMWLHLLARGPNFSFTEFCVCVCVSPGISWRGCIWSPPPQWDIPSASCSWPRTGRTYLRQHKSHQSWMNKSLGSGWRSVEVQSPLSQWCSVIQKGVSHENRWASHQTRMVAFHHVVASGCTGGGPGLDTPAQEPEPGPWPSHPEKRPACAGFRLTTSPQLSLSHEPPVLSLWVWQAYELSLFRCFWSLLDVKVLLQKKFHLSLLRVGKANSFSLECVPV